MGESLFPATDSFVRCRASSLVPRGLRGGNVACSLIHPETRTL